MKKGNHSGLLVTVLSAFLMLLTRVTTFSINSPYRKKMIKVTKILVTPVTWLPCLITLREGAKWPQYQ